MSEFRELFALAASHAADYRETVAVDPKPLSIDYASMLDRVSAPVPEAAADPQTIIDDLVRLSEGGLMPMTGPRFYGWVIGSSHPTGVAADFLVTAWGQNTVFHSPTPATSAIEAVAERWLLELLDLPRESAVGFCTGATVANGICLAAARTAVLNRAGWDPDADGLFGAPPVHVLIGADAHSSLFASLQLIGFGYKRVITVATDAQGRILPEALETAITRLDGPKIIIAQAGQINTGGYDPFVEIARIAKANNAWLHIDGAFGLWARATPARRHLAEGAELADSWCTDGHKWLQVPYDFGLRHRARQGVPAQSDDAMGVVSAHHRAGHARALELCSRTEPPSTRRAGLGGDPRLRAPGHRRHDRALLRADRALRGTPRRRAGRPCPQRRGHQPGGVLVRRR